MIYQSVIEAIGNTPLININFGVKPTILAKLEYLNPGGSIKDRSARYMIEKAEREGRLQPGGTIIEASSGNQGIAVAMIGAAKGYRVIITTNEKFSKDKIKVIKAYGAELIMCKVTEFIEDPESYHSIAAALHNAMPNSIMLNQYFNLDNPEAHYHSLGPEIWRQTEGTITHLIGATGTCGTVSGAGAYLKSKNPSIKIIGVDAATSFRSTHGAPKPYKLEGVGVDFNGPILEKYRTVFDSFLTVTDDEGFAMLKLLAHGHGILVGPSSGAVLHAVHEYAKTLDESATLVTILADSGRAYINTDYYTKETPVEMKNPHPDAQSWTGEMEVI